MTDENCKSVELTRLRKARFLARNERGGELEFGEGDDEAFSPVELLLAGIAGCTALDVDYITAKRAEADSFVVTVGAEKIRDEHGNRLTDIVVRFAVDFPDSEGGTAAREVLPSAVQRSHDRLCTVSRTVEVGTPVSVHIDGLEGDQGPPAPGP
jgi:putative redox protein